MKWYRKITAKAEGDYAALGDALEWFDEQLLDARKDLSPKGRLWTAAQSIPGMMEYRWGQLQELEAIMEFLEIMIDRTIAKWRKHYAENYNRSLSDRFIDKYAEGESEVISLRLLHTEVALVRNKFLGVTKGLEALHYQMSNLTRLKVAGMEDAQL